MMYYELSEMDSFINSLGQSASKHPMFEVEKQLQWMEIASNYPVQMKQRLLQEVLSLTEERAVNLLVQNVQMVVTHLINKVHHLVELIPGIKNDTDFVDIIYSLQKGLNELFEFIQDNLANYVSRDQIMPVTSQQKAIQDLSLQLQNIKEQYAVLPVDAPLVQIAIQPIEYFLSEKLGINYIELDYYHLLLKNMHSLPVSNGMDITIALMQTLNELNFNEGAYLHYLVERFRIKLLDADSLQDKIDTCYLELKLTNQCQLQTSLSLHQDLISIQSQFGNWLREELQYLQSALALQKVPDGHPQNPMLDDTKINLDISVGVFALLIRLLCATGIILNKNKADIVRFFSAYFRTVRSENIPYKHLRNLYDVPRPSSINIGREVIKKLLHEVDKI